MESKPFSRKPPFCLLVAPPAWGKTSLLLNLFKSEVLEQGPWLYISPLRALANEFYARARGIYKTLLVRSQKDFERLKTQSFQVIIVTPELLSEEVLGFLKERRPRVVLDELHLFFLWGERFRPQLLECLFLVASFELEILALTATWLSSIEKRWKWELEFHHDFKVFDFGNFSFANAPVKTFFYTESLRFLFPFQLWLALKQKKKVLYFCRTRNEVDRWMEYSFRHGIKALGCVGGKTEDFLEKLKNLREPQVVFSTTALSHGVNLPPFDHVFLSYGVNCPAFWLQMASRGGRRGEPFILHCVDWPKAKVTERLLALKDLLQQMPICLFFVMLEKCRQKWKALSFRKFPIKIGI